MSLNRALSIFVVIMAALAAGAAVSLVLLTTYLHRATLELESGLHGVRLAEEMQITLRLYDGTADSAERDKIETELRANLDAARRYAGTAEEDRALSEAAYFLDRYFETMRSGKDANEQALRDAALALSHFVNINIGQANASLRDAARLDRMGERIGIVVALGLIAGTAVILVWLHRAAFRPVFAIRDAIKKFAAGQKEVRAEADGPEEFITIANQFNEMADAIARQHRNQAAFLAAIAHDLRNPISALKISADVLSAPAVPADKLSTLMGVIKRQVTSLDRMISDLLDSARIESGNLELRFEEVDGRIIAQDTFNLFRAVSEAHRFTIHLPETPVPLSCDRLRIEQVLNNLLSNAIKYSPRGGEVELSLTASGNEGLFKVSDQGRGIPEEEIQYIFEPFRRIHSSRENLPGIGLGLSVAQRIVHAHGGRIGVKSKLGYGTTFTVYLPPAPLRELSA